MVELRVVDPHDFTPRGRIDHVGISCRDLPFSYDALIIERAGIGHRKIRRTIDWLARVGIDLVVARGGGDY